MFFSGENSWLEIQIKLYKILSGGIKNFPIHSDLMNIFEKHIFEKNLRAPIFLYLAGRSSQPLDPCQKSENQKCSECTKLIPSMTSEKCSHESFMDAYGI